MTAYPLALKWQNSLLGIWCISHLILIVFFVVVRMLIYATISVSVAMLYFLRG